MRPNYLLKIQKLNAGYENLQVLYNVSLFLKKGEVVGIFGPNGAGKSTILKSLFKLCDIYSGRMIYEGKEINEISVHELSTIGISYLSQDYNVFKNLRVIENLKISGLSLNSQNLRKRLSKVYKIFPYLEKRKNDFAINLSGGEKQQLALAMILMKEPKLILLDEPSIGLAPKIIKEIYQKIKILNSEYKISLLIVEQNIKAALNVIQRFYLLNEGKVVYQGKKEKFTFDLVHKLYL